MNEENLPIAHISAFVEKKIEAAQKDIQEVCDRAEGGTNPHDGGEMFGALRYHEGRKEAFDEVKKTIALITKIRRGRTVLVMPGDPTEPSGALCGETSGI